MVDTTTQYKQEFWLEKNYLTLSINTFWFCKSQILNTTFILNQSRYVDNTPSVLNTEQFNSIF